ncbi:MAG: hypothetical protein WBA42_23045 [Mesorhizobium sp.]
MMTPERLERCRSVIRWTPNTLVRYFGYDVSLVWAWLNGQAKIPADVGLWIEAVAQAHEAAETLKP